MAPPANSAVGPTVFVPGSLRLAVEVDGLQAFVGRAAAGVDGDYCTLLVAPVSDERATSASVGCSHLADLARDGANLSRYPADGSGRGTIVGFVPDGTVSVEVDGAQAVLGDNAFIARGVDPKDPVDVTIVSHGGTRSIVVPGPLGPTDEVSRP